MNTNIYFVRHGQTDANKARIFSGQIDTPLNDIGRSQVQETCKTIRDKNLKWEIVISSPLKRAYETAQIINRNFPINTQIIIDPLTIERSFGAAEGIPITEENYNRIMNCEFENEETENEIVARAKIFINNLLTTYKGKNILVVTHSHFLKACFRPFIPTLKFDTKTVNAGLSYLSFNDQCQCIIAELIMK